jgi:hypothetical protein
VIPIGKIWNVVKEVIGIGKSLSQSDKLNAPMGASKAQKAIDDAKARSHESDKGAR